MEPKKKDDYTINLASLSVAHVKVEANLTKPLPDIVEVERQNGKVVEVNVEYPWLPSTCSHCNQLAIFLGTILRLLVIGFPIVKRIKTLHQMLRKNQIMHQRRTKISLQRILLSKVK